MSRRGRGSGKFGSAGPGNSGHGSGHDDATTADTQDTAATTNQDT